MITADYTDLLRQASMTAEEYMARAIRAIDEIYDEKGYAKKHPELVIAFMRTCATDLGAATLAKEIHEGLQEIAATISSFYLHGGA